jgi:hypothetical protein
LAISSPLINFAFDLFHVPFVAITSVDICLCFRQLCSNVIVVDRGRFDLDQLILNMGGRVFAASEAASSG